jgi:asparagine synthase (glutamine-hydrolysing)
VFETEGDTEVLLALHLRDGPAGVDGLNGQFAYALHDARSDDLWLFRDHLGVLPLYYYWDGSLFLFASEVKALLPLLPKPAAVDEGSLKEHLALRCVGAPHTLFENVKKLPPGHRLRLDGAGRLEVEAYWKLPTEPPLPEIGVGDAVEQVAARLERAVASRMIADVPVGAYLSGGVDSSLVVALMARLGSHTVETFSAGFQDPRYDELPHARRASQLLGTRHHEVVVAPHDFEKLWPRLTWYRDAPVSEPSDVAIHRLATRASGIVKVLLSGEGADELFAGYPKYRYARLAEWIGRIPAALRSPLLRALERAVPERAWRVAVVARSLQGADEADRFLGWFASFTSGERDRLLPGLERMGHREIWRRASGDILHRMLYFDCHTWLADNLLERGDRMAMSASIESRPPLLDRELVELAFRLPSSLKVRGGSTKWILKEVARRFLPASIVDRPKVGFRVPLDAWFRGGLREMTHDLLLSGGSMVRERMNRGEVEALLESHERGRHNGEKQIWTLLGLEIWHRAFFRGEADSIR